jgi:hypothetical protein
MRKCLIFSPWHTAFAFKTSLSQGVDLILLRGSKELLDIRKFFKGLFKSVPARITISQTHQLFS